jgi:hypothetical protein
MNRITALALLLYLLSAAHPAHTATESPGSRAGEEAVIPGIIDFGEEGSKNVVTAPSNVKVAEDFKITVTTFGGGCEREGTTSMIKTATGADIIVYDVTAATRPGVICTAEIKRLPHKLTLRFDKPGQALIRVWGRRVGPDTPPFGMPAILEHPLMIQ